MSFPSRPQLPAEPGAAGSLLGAVARTATAEPTFLLVTPDSVEVRTMAWFSDYWSREAGHSRARQRPPLSFWLLVPGSARPQSFSVHGECHHGHAYADGRRFLACSATITTAPEHPADEPEHFRFRYWQYDPEMERLLSGDEPPVDDVETYPLPG
ncbi:hypothetical protein ABZ896_12245 [Streptomyces sp. NPDC047072]|uniref:hypothetical protein n=1 Tax=Streptomyces sp. NPDC047072 TaxID=3154809 RepID=UPI0033D63641